MHRTAIILIVDDHAANRQTLWELLDRPDYSLVEASDGQTALDLAAETPPDLILLDVMMPGLNGFEVCRRIRANPKIAEVPIILVTALDDQASRLAGLEAGADDFITKPFNAAELRARVRTITRLNRYRRLHETLAVSRENEAWLKAIFDQAAVGVVQTDVRRRGFVRFNQRFCDFLGYTRQELAQLSHSDITHPGDLARDLEQLERLRDGTIREYTQEKRFLHKDGAILWASVAVSGIGPPEAPPTAFIAVSLDITERRRLEEHFVQAQKMEALGQFSGGIAHDFNNILAAISGYAELSRMVLKENPEVRGYLDSVLGAAKRAADLVGQILTFSRREPEVRRALQLQPIVKECLKLMRATIPTTIDFEAVVAEDLPNVLANANQLQQVLMNLGINAWHAMAERPGRMEVRLEKFDVSLEFSATQPRLRPGVYVRLSVSDTGCGMDPATLRRIFEPFFTTKRAGAGTGLGLAVVYGIMDGHDGVITVHSQLGEGTVFRLYFPPSDGEVAPAPDENGSVPRGHSEAVLVVDDEEVLAVLMQKTLTNLGYDVTHTTNPVVGLAMVRADPQRFKLVVSDQTMPGMTGLNLATEIRQIHSGLPIILMSGYGASLSAERIDEAGVRQLMHKPCLARDLGRAVHAAIGGEALPNDRSNRRA